MVTQEDREMKPHREEMEIVNLGVGEERKEVKVGTGMTTLIRDKLVVKTTKTFSLGHTKICPV